MSYDLLARFYDLENADFIEDLDFWVALAKESGGPVLELGCGSGRVTQQIARVGVDITGIDNSQAMLMLARAKLRHTPELAKRATLLYGDMLSFEIKNPVGQEPNSPNTNLQFALCIVPFNTFMHLHTTSDQLAVLARVRKHLAPGGKLVMDITNPAPAYTDPGDETLTHERTFRNDTTVTTVQQFSTLRIDRTAQLAHIVYHYDTVAEDNTLKRTLVPITLRYTFPIEMGLLLDKAGFKLTHLYGDYDESPLDDESGRMVVVAEVV
jgi:SAM-dependent methyltransferase